VIATNNDKPKLAAPTLLRKSVEAHWRPLDAPDRPRAYAEQFPHVYRTARGSSRDLDEHFVTPAASTRLAATSHCESVQGRRTKAVLFSYPDRCRSAAGHPFNRPLGPGILGGSPNPDHSTENSHSDWYSKWGHFNSKMNSSRSQIFSGSQMRRLSTFFDERTAQRVEFGGQGIGIRSGRWPLPVPEPCLPLSS
jgi:hypothetical protein